MQPRILAKLLPIPVLTLLAAPVLALALVSGSSNGNWTAPTGGSNGFAQGVLADQTGAAQFAFDATLVEQAVVFGVELGSFQGVLDNGSGQAWPLFTVSGSYSGAAASHSGSFIGQIARQNSPSGPVTLIGRMGGQYMDSTPATTLGSYKGRWLANL